MDLDQYGVSFTHGFLPVDPPLKQLPSRYRKWDQLAYDIPRLVDDGTLVREVEDLPTITTVDLQSEVDWQRAYVILGFIANAYLWGGEKPLQRLPACIAVPFRESARHLDMPPVATYAAENLWNFEPIATAQSIEDPANFRALTTFTGTSDESWFYALPAAIEMRGRHIIPLAINALDAVEKRSLTKVTQYLGDIAGHIQAMTKLLTRMYEKNDPGVFYKHIRPFLTGTTSPENPYGVFYEDGRGGGEFVKVKGPTAAQSSLFPLLDEFLGVRHDPSKAPGDFLQEMRAYMPPKHRQFLSFIASKAHLRSFVESQPDEVKLQAAYSDCITSLAGYRTKHLQLISRYIVIPSRDAARSRPPPETVPGTAGRVPTDDELVLGTGGTAPVQFLKLVRDDTFDGLSKSSQGLPN
ncbi:MAG: hypothetical protein Q9191_005863 [Dirinaria sp. TL-2023a]